MEREIVHLPEKNRFETVQDELTSYIRYTPFKGGINIISTYVPEELEGQGIASVLTRHVLEYAREHHLKVIPTCGFTIVYLRRHPEYGVLVVE